MDDKQRLTEMLDRLSLLEGLSTDQYSRLSAELEQVDQRFGYDQRGRLVVAMFDAKSYDMESFDRRNHDRFSFHYLRSPLSADSARAAEGCSVVCIFVNDICDRGVVQTMASIGVQLIALRCAGFNNVDLAACQEHGIEIVRVPAYSPYAVAEHTIGLMLVLNRRLHHAYNRNRAGIFVLEGLTGFDMRGKTVGVIGTGKIGQCVVDILLGIGCHVLAYDQFPNDRLMSCPQVQYVELDRLLRHSDVITLHIPLFPETHHIIDAAAIQQMRDGVMLINTSRGGLVDTPALIDGLKSGKIGFAGLDVYEEEAGVFLQDFSEIWDKVLTDDVLARLLTFNNVVVTSHQAFLTNEALTNIADTTLDNIEEFQQGKRAAELTNSVTTQ